MTRNPAHRLTATTLVAVSLGVALVGCTGGTEPINTTATTPPPAPPISNTPLPSTVVHYVPQEEKIKGFLDNQTAPASLGQFSVESKFIKVYVSCVGSGDILIKIAGVGKFPIPCNTVGVVPSENEFQVSDVKTYAVALDSAKGQRWAVTLALGNNTTNK